jgi:hypothetical protein
LDQSFRLAQRWLLHDFIPSQKNTDYQGLAEFKALTLRVNYDKKKFDT